MISLFNAIKHPTKSRESLIQPTRYKKNNRNHRNPLKTNTRARFYSIQNRHFGKAMMNRPNES
jgi:hypothetical protein